MVALVGSFGGSLPGAAERHAVDLGSTDAVHKLVRAVQPQAIINAAAVSEPAKCDEDLPRSQRLNVELPAQLAQLANETGARLLHLSSEQAFAGNRAPYRTTDPVAPINLYARQKVESEVRVHAIAPTLAATIRAPLLMGNSPGERRSLHERLLADWAAGKTPRLYVDEFRQTCTAENLAQALLELCTHTELCGVFHWAGAELLSRYEQGERLRAHFGLSATRTPLTAVKRADEPAASAKRQANLALDLAPLDKLLRTKPETFAQQMTTLRVPAALRSWSESARA